MDTDDNNFTTALDYDWQSQRVNLQLKFLYEGCYHTTIKYKGIELHNGDFDIIVLNSELVLKLQNKMLKLFFYLGIDSTLVHKNVASKNHNICYEAKLIGVNNEKLQKPKKVLCYVSPKQLIVKELILKFIPKRLYTFRLCPSTKVKIKSVYLKKLEWC